MSGGGGGGGGSFGRSLFPSFCLLLFLLLPIATRAASCARALYAPAVARPGTAFWIVAQFDGGPDGADLSPAACAGRGADCGLFSASSSNGSVVVLPPLQGFPSLARASIARARLTMPLSARTMINVTLSRPACNASSSPLSVLVSPASLLPPRPPVLSIARAPSLVDATFDVRLDFSDRVAWLDPSAVLVNSSSSGAALGSPAPAASAVAASASGNSTNNSTNSNSTAPAATNTTTRPPQPTTTTPSLPSLMAVAGGVRVAMAVRPTDDVGAAAGTALVLTVDRASPGQLVRVQVPARAFAVSGGGGGGGTNSAAVAQNSSVLAVRIPGPSSLLPGLGVLSGRLLPSALGVSAGVCVAAAMLAPGSYVATVTCGSGGLLRSAGHAQAAAALGAALSSPAFGLAPSVAVAAGGLRWSMLQWLPAAFNGPLSTFLAGWALRVEEARQEQRALKLVAAMGPLAAEAVLARERAALRATPLAAVTRSGAWRETIGAAPMAMISGDDGLVRDIGGGVGGAAATPATPPPPAASALADADTATELDAWLWDMQIGVVDGGATNSSSNSTTTTGSGVLSFAMASSAGTSSSPSDADRAAYLSPRALQSRQALPAGAWVLEADTPEKERRRALLAAAWVAFLGAAEVAGAAMFGACLLHAAAAAGATGSPDGGAPSSSSSQPAPGPAPSSPQPPPPRLLLPPPPRILASLPVGGEGGFARRRAADKRDPSLARRAIRNNAMLAATAAAAAEEEEEHEAVAATSRAADAAHPQPPPIPSPPLFVWPKLMLLVGVASWPPLVHLACGLLPSGAPGWMVAAVAALLAALGFAAAAWMLVWSTRQGAQGLLRPEGLLDAQATSTMVVGGTSADEDAARCRELEREDREDAAEEAEEEERRQEQQRRRPPSSLRPPEPSATPRMTTCTITEIRQQPYASGVVAFADRPTNARGQLLLLQSPPPEGDAAAARSPSPPRPSSRSPSPVAERLMPFVPPIYYVPMSSASSSPSPGGAAGRTTATTTAVTLLRPVLLQRETTVTPPPPLPSRSPVLSLGSQQGQQRRARRDAGDDNNNDEDGDDAMMELASVAAAAAASARFVASTGIVAPAAPAPLPLLLRAQAGDDDDEGDNIAAAAAARQAADALLQARLVAYAGAAGPLLADVVGPVVLADSGGGGEDGDDQQQQLKERALQSRAAPAFLGANALAFTGTLLVCGLSGLLGAVSARPPLDAVGAAAAAVVGPSGGGGASSSAALTTAGVWILLSLRVVWAAFATQAYASASAAIFEAVCTACEMGLLIVAAVALPVLRGSWPEGRGGSGSPQAKAALSVAALILLLVMMIALTVGEAVRALVVIFEAGGVKCWTPARRRRAGGGGGGAASPSPSLARVAPRRRPF
jgi:hypothetical protein